MIPRQAQQAEFTAGWSVVTRTTATAEDVLVTNKVGRTVTYPFTGRAVAVVAPLGPGKGRFKVRLDGQAVATVDLARTKAAARRMVWVSDALSPGPHTLRIVSLVGRVELDAFLVLR
jgi:hypothetical protein